MRRILAGLSLASLALSVGCGNNPGSQAGENPFAPPPSRDGPAPRQMDKLNPEAYVEPTFSVDDGALSINGTAFILDESDVESLAEILGPWDSTFSNGAYTNYVWESGGFFAQVGYTGKVQHLQLMCEPTSFNEFWEMGIAPFGGMLVVDGYLVAPDITPSDWEVVLGYDIATSEIDYEIRSRPCSITVMLTESGDGLKRIVMSNH